MVSRDKPNAIINTPALMFERINDLTVNGYLESIFEKKIYLKADTFCVHGDSPNILKCLNGLNDLFDEKI